MRRVMVCVWAPGIVLAMTIGGQRSLAQTRAASGAQTVATLHSGPASTSATAPDAKEAKVDQKASGAVRAAGTLLNSQSLTTLVRRLVITVLVLAVALLLLIGIQRLKRRGMSILERKRHMIPTFRFRGLELVSAETLFRNIGRIFWGAYVAAFALVVLGAALLVFGQFPATQSYAQQVGTGCGTQWSPLCMGCWAICPTSSISWLSWW